MDRQLITISYGGSDNRCELEIWMDEHQNSDYEYDSVTNIDSSQMKWAREERERINYAHNIVIPEIQKIINNDINWKNKYRTELPGVNYLGILPSEMKDLDKYDIEGHYGDLLKCFSYERRKKGGYGDDGRFSKHGGQSDGHYLFKYTSYAHLNGECVRDISHLWGSNINNRNNIRLAERIEDCKYDIKTVSYNVDKISQKISSIDDKQTQLVSNLDNIKYNLENLQSSWDSQLKSQNKLFVTQLVFNNRIGSFESDIFDKISGVERLCFNSINSIESKLTSKISEIESSLADMLIEIQTHYENEIKLNSKLNDIQSNYKKMSLKTNENEIKLNSKLNDIQIKNNKVIDELELKLQNITETFSRKHDNYQQNIDVLTKRQNFMYFIITIVCVYYIFTNVYCQFNSTNTQNMLLLD